MKTNYPLTLALTAVAILTAGNSLRAADTDSTTTTTTTTQSTVTTQPPSSDSGLTNNLTEIYQSHELSFDGFAMGSMGNYTLVHPAIDRVRNNGQGGAGVGLNYFITRYVGVGAEAYSQNTRGVFIDNASVNLLLRLPLGESGFAPYLQGGGGHQFDAAKLWFGQAGVGMEYRFCHNIGMFVDARAVWPNETKTYGVGRVGLQFAF